MSAGEILICDRCGDAFCDHCNPNPCDHGKHICPACEGCYLCHQERGDEEAGAR